MRTSDAIGAGTLAASQPRNGSATALDVVILDGDMYAMLFLIVSLFGIFVSQPFVFPSDMDYSMLFLC